MLINAGVWGERANWRYFAFRTVAPSPKKELEISANQAPTARYGAL